MIKRELYMRHIRPFIGNDLIKVLTGIRRSGKSVMLELIQEELKASGLSEDHFICINFEDMTNAHLCTAETLHAEMLRRISTIQGKAYLFLDEIQEVKEWETCINSLRVESDCDIYLTGSNAKLLSGELATYLAGRYVEFTVYPFSFSEFLELYRETVPEATARDAFSRYLVLGGMPYLGKLSYKEGPCRQYLQDVYNSVELKDIVKRNNVRDVDLLERVIGYLSVNVGQLFSASSISKYFRSEHRTVATETILNYIRYCTDAFLFYRVRRKDISGKKILSVNDKYYLADHGIREAVYGGNMRDINMILENIVFMESLRRGYKVMVGKTGNREIDFICEKQSEKVYIQVTYLFASEDTIDREFRVFDSVRDNYPKYVVSLDELDMSRNGIKHRNIRDFLLAEEWN
ncbi:MAG: ATP-binding protein [Spirochaetia bacterium]|nr:ATP-binding protein [Spirochaetia bacterium]